MKQWERVEELKVEAGRSLQIHLDESQIDWLSAAQLMELTEECPGEFLGRDPRRGYFQPLVYSTEVFENFLNNQTYYFDKFSRPQK